MLPPLIVVSMAPFTLFKWTKTEEKLNSPETMLVLNLALVTVMLNALMILNSLMERLIFSIGTLLLPWVNMALAVPRWISGRLTEFLLPSPLILATSMVKLDVRMPTAVVILLELPVIVTKMVAI